MRNDEYVEKTTLSKIRQTKKETRESLFKEQTLQYPDFWNQLDKTLPGLSYTKRLIIADLIYSTFLRDS
jgi:hypothetical protein